MNKKFISQIQKKIISLLKKDKNKSLYLLAEDNCSEMSRLVGCWILQKLSDTKVFILRGKKVKNIKNKCHDILAVENQNKIYLIDTTVWQFFKRKRSILIKTVNTFEDALIIIKEIYSGDWFISERLNKNNYKQMDKWKKIIILNIKDIK